MIYLISNQQRLFSNDIKLTPLEHCFEYCSGISEIGLDMETFGLDPYTKKPICIQLGDKNSQFIIDTSCIPLRKLTPLLEDTSKTYIGHNIKFDLKFLLHEGIIINSVYDTYVAECILWNGYENMRKSLDHVSKRYTGVFLDKSIRGNIQKEGLSNRVIKYSAQDISQLHEIKEKQLERATQWDLNNALRLNNYFVPVMAYLEYCGFKLDTVAWENKIQQDLIEKENKLKELTAFIEINDIKEFISPQLTMWETSRVSINWNSPAQVVKLFNILGIDTQILDKDTGDMKNTVNSTLISKQINKHPIIKVYIEDREALKNCSTYGKNWFNFINSITGRIHTKYQQWVTTGRMSSGGKDTEDGKVVKYPNAQNIPSDEITRKCIIADKGNILVNADYDSQEVRVFANWCLDPTLLRMFDEGFTDMHAYTAWHIFPEIRGKYPDLTKESIKLIKQDFPNQRQISKTGNFAIQYGGTGYTVAENCNISLEEGEKFYNEYFEAFKGIKKYFDECYKNAKKRGWIVYNTVSKEKYFIPKELKDGKIKNSSLNFPIQGSSAAITKYAGVLYWRHLIEAGLVFKVKIAIICHDEYLIECPLDIAEQEAEVLKKCMEKAGDLYCKRIPLTATPVITKFWTH